MTTVAPSDWASLSERGYVHRPAFLSPEEIEFLRADFDACHGGQSGRIRLDVVTGERGPIHDKILGAMAALREVDPANPDTILWGTYISTRDTDFSWHQDFDTHYFTQDTPHSLNFYMPIVKPVPEKSNVRIIPFDRLDARVRSALEGNGARYFNPRAGGVTSVADHSGERLREFDLDVDLDGCAHTPCLAAGDLLVLRGDLIHRTQDAETLRVAASFRTANSAKRVARRRLARGSLEKLDTIVRLRHRYVPIFDFYRRNGLADATIGDLLKVSREAGRRRASSLRDKARTAVGIGRLVADLAIERVRPA